MFNPPPASPLSADVICECPLKHDIKTRQRQQFLNIGPRITLTIENQMQKYYLSRDLFLFGRHYVNVIRMIPRVRGLGMCTENDCLSQ